MAVDSPGRIKGTWGTLARAGVDAVRTGEEALMRWEGQGESDNVEDRRGMRIGAAGAGLGCGGVLLVLVISS